jgi:hypothetical protein
LLFSDEGALDLSPAAVGAKEGGEETRVRCQSVMRFPSSRSVPREAGSVVETLESGMMMRFSGGQTEGSVERMVEEWEARLRAKRIVRERRMSFCMNEARRGLFLSSTKPLGSLSDPAASRALSSVALSFESIQRSSSLTGSIELDRKFYNVEEEHWSAVC